MAISLTPFWEDRLWDGFIIDFPRLYLQFGIEIGFSMTQETLCRHEYVKIFQRKLKGLERRLVSTRAYLPTGFKTTDLVHLGEAGYCFCSKCRARLHPRRTRGEKLAARMALARRKALEFGLPANLNELVLAVTKEDLAQEARANELIGEPGGQLEGEDAALESETSQTINVEELELASIDAQDIEADGVKLSTEDDSLEVSDEDH